MAVFLYLLLASAASFSLIEAKQQKSVSSFFSVCKGTDPNLNQCVKNTITEARPKLIKGVPELDIVPLDPLYLPFMELSQGLGLEFKLKEIYISGLRNFVINNVEVNLKTLEMTIAMKTPFIHFDGDYEMGGRIIVLPVKGFGKVKFNFTNVDTTSYSKLEKYKKDGKEYIRVKEMKWNIEPENAQSYFSNLFNGDKTLGEATNKFLNDNWKAAYQAYKNLPEEGFAQMFKDLSNRVYAHYPYNEWFPE